jgi:hypothetical protein
MEGVTDLVQSPAGMTDSELYEYDFPAWCSLQADRLRTTASRATGKDQPDWNHVIEEIADMGSAERHRVEGLLIQAMVHLRKLRADPASADAAHWAIEKRAVLVAARRHYAPSMRQRLDLPSLFSDAIFQLEGRRVNTPCPFTLDDLLTLSSDVAALVARLS